MARYNLEGWKNSVWLKKNASQLRLILAGLLGLLTAGVDALPDQYRVIAGTLVTLLAKYVMDKFDYWQQA